MFEYLMNEEISLDEKERVAAVLRWLHDGVQWRPMTDAEVTHRDRQRVGDGESSMEIGAAGGEFLEGAAAPSRRLRTGTRVSSTGPLLTTSTLTTTRTRPAVSTTSFITRSTFTGPCFPHASGVQCLAYSCGGNCTQDRKFLSSLGTDECFPVSTEARVRMTKVRLRALCGAPEELSPLYDADTCVDVRSSLDQIDDRFVLEQGTHCAFLLSALNDMDDESDWCSLVLGANGTEFVGDEVLSNRDFCARKSPELALTFRALGGLHLRKTPLAPELQGVAEDWVQLVEANDGTIPLDGLWGMARIVSKKELDQEAFVSWALNLLFLNKKSVCAVNDWRRPRRAVTKCEMEYRTSLVASYEWADVQFDVPTHFAPDPVALENCMMRDGGISLSAFCGCRAKGNLPGLFGGGCRGMMTPSESGLTARRGCRFYRAGGLILEVIPVLNHQVAQYVAVNSFCYKVADGRVSLAVPRRCANWEMPVECRQISGDLGTSDLGFCFDLGDLRRLQGGFVSSWDKVHSGDRHDSGHLFWGRPGDLHCCACGAAEERCRHCLGLGCLGGDRADSWLYGHVVGVLDCSFYYAECSFVE